MFAHIYGYLLHRYEARNEADKFSQILPIKEGSFDGELFQLPSQWVKTGVEKLMREQMEELRTKVGVRLMSLWHTIIHGLSPEMFFMTASWKP